jgi:hypothetical protein
MYQLSNFQEDDINDSPTHEDWGSPAWGRSINWLYFLGWLFNMGRGAATVDSKRTKLRNLREGVLPRAPNTLICPQCFTTIERF